MELVEELAGTLFGGVITDPSVLEGYRRDQAAWANAGWPLALARPVSTADVQNLVRWAARHRVPLVPRGAGSGLAGGASAIDGAVVVSFERMNAIVSIDEAAMTATVQPGVINGDLKAAVHDRGLWYPPDPASYAISTIGGNVATNAGGLCCVKYGVTGDYVLALEAVLADGTVMVTRSRTRKDVAGYDLTRLLCGSEGTLALITEITVRLRRRGRPPSTLLALFPTLEGSAEAVAAIVRASDPSLLEIMDQATIRAVENYAHLDLDVTAGAMLIAQSDSPEPSELATMAAACERAGATLVARATDEEEGRMLLNARRLAYPSVERLGTALVDDVAVPVPKLAEMFRRIERVANENEILIATVAHAGDGNLHPVVIFPRNDERAEARAISAFEALMRHAIELGGTISGEHGTGLLKRKFLPQQLGAASLALHRRIKDAFDPLGILNPGKMLGR